MFPVFLFSPITAMCRTGSHLIRMNSLLCVQPCVCSAAGGEEQEEAQDVMGGVRAPPGLFICCSLAMGRAAGSG